MEIRTNVPGVPGVPGTAVASSIEPEPVIVDLGRQRRKRIKAMMRGEGRLFHEVTASLADLRANGTIDANAQPVVVVIREKRRRVKSKGFSLLR